MEEFINHCRFCGSSEICELDVFQQDKESNFCIAEDLFKLCNIKLENTEGLPTKICTNCNLSVTNLKDFLTNLNKTQEMLIEFRNNKTKKKCEFFNTKKNKENYINEDFKSESLENDEIKKEIENTSECSSKGKEDFTDDFYSEITNNHKEKDQKINISKDHKKVNVTAVEIYKCEVCDKNFKNKAGLISHQKNIHGLHIKTEKKGTGYLCPHCDKKFKSVNGRWSHIYTVHDNSMKVICDECGKEFPTKYHLVKHKDTHKEVKDLQCPLCPAKFKRQRGLHVHIGIHGESFSCEICGAILNTKYLLNQHMIVHSDVKKYKCYFCNKNFKRTRNLYSHIETHVGIRAFQCCSCSMSFVQYMSYRNHLKRTHPETFAKMLAKGELAHIRSTSNALSSEKLKALNEAAKNGDKYRKDL